MSFAEGRERLKRLGFDDERTISLIDIEAMQQGEIQIKGISQRLGLTL